MRLDNDIIQQVKGIFADLSSKYTLVVTGDPSQELTRSLTEFAESAAETSEKISMESHQSMGEKPSMRIHRDGQALGIIFRGVPGGHEFTSFLLAILNADNKGKNLPDEAIERRIRALNGPIQLTTYVSLDCTNCPDVVQALNVMTLYNPYITNTMVDGGSNQEEVKAMHIGAVPTVYCNGEQFHVGRGSLGELLGKLEERFSSKEEADAAPQAEKEFDILILGGGPAGSAAAIYSARKGLNVGVVCTTVGGQVKETTGIENLISSAPTTGTQLAVDLQRHMNLYPIKIYDQREITSVALEGPKKVVKVKGGEIFTASQVIIATGASWRKLNIEGETEYIGRGVAFCPHCDGPIYKGQDVAVIGGGNSGVEAAIDLAGICKHVTLFEFLDQLKADEVLQKKVRSLDNVDIYTSSQTTKVIGDGNKVTGIEVKDRKTDEVKTIPLSAIFVQIGLRPNTALFEGQLNINRAGEIETDNAGRTNVEGVFAAGDVTTVPYKQIAIAIGEGAKAALSAFDQRMRTL